MPRSHRRRSFELDVLSQAQIASEALITDSLGAAAEGFRFQVGHTFRYPGSLLSRLRSIVPKTSGFGMPARADKP